ncbi:MAG: glycosyltransferase [Clostridia bacterium]|nr:glycosyltransferase [Clostridia bacterium]
MKPIRVLVVGMTATVGGIENFLMAYCGRIDRTRVQFDFLTRFANAVYPERRASIGQTYVVPRRSEDPVGYYRQVRAFFDAHGRDYDVIWDNECMFNDMTPLKLAAEYGIPVRIAHSHNPQNMDVSLRGRAQELLHRMQRRRLGRYANVLWACSEESARWVCPAMDIPMTVIPNAIDARAFRYKSHVRDQVRRHYGLEDCLVVGHVGRLQYQKNQTFLLEAFARLRQREPRARLVLVGDGPDLTDLEARAVALDIASDVLFLGVRDDVPRLMQAFDLFVMPSHFEGLGMAAVEAQAAGLPCILSDAVPKMAAITEDVIFLPPDDPDLWAERMLDVLEAERFRPDNVTRIAEAGYEISQAAVKMTERIEQLVDRSASFRRRFLLTMLSTQEGVPAMNKARQDVQFFAEQMDYVPIALSAGDTARGDWKQQLILLGRVMADWTRLFFKLRHNDVLLMQYPYFPVKGAPVARFAMHLLQWKGVKLAALIHDLDSLRCVGGDAARWSDQELLPRFDRIITHNERMSSYLINQGVAEERLVELTLFDYRTDAHCPVRTLEKSVCIAGNLSPDKAGYLNSLPDGGVHWHLYGQGWAGEERADVTWYGAFPPEELPGKLEGSFGLVWDGNSPQVCGGAYGCYLLLNAPHKLSMYLAAGMPVAVWARSAQAEFVKHSGVGLVIDSLSELPGHIAALSQAQYEAMAERARAVGASLREGRYTQRALKKIERI